MNTDESELRAFMQGLGYETYLIEDDKSELRHLDPEQKIVSSYVFNVVFINSEGEKEYGF